MQAGGYCCRRRRVCPNGCGNMRYGRIGRGSGKGKRSEMSAGNSQKVSAWTFTAVVGEGLFSGVWEWLNEALVAL